MKESRSPRVTGAIRQAVLLLAAVAAVTFASRAAFRFFYRAAYPIKYSSYVERYSTRNNLPASLVYAVIRTESGFNPDAHSHVGARGLMQITEDTFKWIAFRENEPTQLGFDALLDEETNIRFGAALLRLHLEEFGSVENALCAYHAGRSSLQNWLADPSLSADGRQVNHIPFGDTRRYVKKVLETQQIYKSLYNMK